MPQLLPAIDIATIKPDSEREVISALMRQLPEECIILHSWETLRRDRGPDGRGVARLVQGEADAVVLWPGKGMLVLEVKGGGISVDNNGRWTTTDRHGCQHDIKDPFAQARRNMHTIVDRVAENLGMPKQKLGFTYGYAVVMPSKRTEGALSANVDRDILCDGIGLAKIGLFVERALKVWGGKVDPNARTVSLTKVRDALLPSMRLMPSLVARIQTENSVLHRLTQEQSKFLDYVRVQTRARVWGGAGSGKTMLAVQQARRFATEGKQTMFLCYNRSLAAWLREATSDDRVPFEVLTFHELCESVTKKAGFAFEVSEDADDFWKCETAELLIEHADAAGLKIDALVVDEGQDFRASWWDALACLVPDEAPVYAFYDEHQNLFLAEGESALIDWLPLRFDLPINCRNTRAIADWCANIVSISSGVCSGAPEGLAVTVDISGNEDVRRAQVEKLISAWLTKEKIDPQRIAILSPCRPERGCLGKVASIAGVPLTSDIAEWQCGKSVLLTTIRSFKGLEADALVMIDLPKPGSKRVFGTADFYVGCSRAKSVLHLIATEPFDRDYAIAA